MEEIVRVSPEDIIEKIAAKMLAELHVFHDEAYVPTRYIVRLHPDDCEAVAKYRSLLQQGAGKRLTHELSELNRHAQPNRVTQKLADWNLTQLKRISYKPALKNAKDEVKWEIDLAPDFNNRIPRGGVEVEAELDVETRNYDGGNKTFNAANPPGQATGAATAAATPEPATRRIYARLSYEEQQANKSYDMTAKHIFIGRGGPEIYTDLVLNVPDDVSREHLQIRYNETSRRFEIKDTSTFGTSVNGVPVPPSYEIDPATGLRRPREHWAPLPSSALIRLADIFDLQFAAESETVSP